MHDSQLRTDTYPGLDRFSFQFIPIIHQECLGYFVSAPDLQGKKCEFWFSEKLTLTGSFSVFTFS